MVVCLWMGMSRNRLFFALIEPVEGGRGSATTGGPPGMVALAKSIVTPYAPGMRRCMGSRTPCCATTPAPLAGRGLWSSCVLLLLQDLLWCRTIPIPTGGALSVGDALEPLPCATLRTGMPRGMVHWEEVRRRRRRLIRGHRKRCSSGHIRGLGVPLRHATLSGGLVAPHGSRAPARDTGMAARVRRSGRRQATG